MNNLNKITKILGATFVLVCATNSYAATTVNSTATVTVKNVIVLAEDAAINFGTVRATVDLTDANNFATLVLSPLGTLTSPGDGVGVSRLTSLDSGTAGLYTITEAAAFTPVEITLPTSAVSLLPQGAPAGTPGFTLDTFTAAISGGTSDGTTITLSSSVGSITTDLNGAASFSVGGTLSTDKTGSGTGTYQDVDYTGSYAVVVDY